MQIFIFIDREGTACQRQHNTLWDLQQQTESPPEWYSAPYIHTLL